MAKSRYSLLCLLLFLTSVPGMVSAQELWTGGTLELELTKKLDLEIEEQLRLEDDFVWYNQFLTEVGLQYDLPKRFEVKWQYRYSLRPEDDEQRISGDLSYDTKQNDWDLEFRFRTRYQIERQFDDEDWTNTIRGRIGVRYDIAKEANPFFEIETFYRLGEQGGIRKWRYTLGIGLPFSDHLSADFFYRIEKNINEEFPTTDHVIGISFKYEIELHRD